MKRKLKSIAVGTIALAATVVMLYSCNDHTVIEPVKPSAKEKSVVYIGGGNSKGSTTRIAAASECTLTLISSDRLFDRDTIYVLIGDVRVTNNSILTIEDGTVIKGDKPTRAKLTITRGSKIIANGTPASPIVFTSSEPAGSRAPGDWSGIFIIGFAPNNDNIFGNSYAPGYPELPWPATCETSPPLHGGTDCYDNSGVLTYVRIEFAGWISSGDFTIERGGLNLCSVGSATTINHIQVSFCGDDSFLWAGGCVNAKHLVSFRTQDDDFDTDLGYSGRVQFGIALRDPQIADVSASNGIESDNYITGSPIRTPYTSAVFSNFTLIGPYNPANTNSVINTTSATHADGIHLRRYTALEVHNTVIVGFRLNQFKDITDNPEAILSHNVTAVPGYIAGPTCYSEDSTPEWTTEGTNTCRTATIATPSTLNSNGLIRQSGLQNAAWTLTSPNLNPFTAGNYISPLVAGGVNATLLDNNMVKFGPDTTFFSPNVTSTIGGPTFYIGAKTSDEIGWNFNTGWLNFDPQSEPYL